MLEDHIQENLPEYFKDFMKVYANTFVYEQNYIDTLNDLKWKIHTFCDFKTMFEFSSFFKMNELGLKIPFAFDEGGWIFSICLDKIDNGAVFIYKTNDFLPEDAFLKISSNFEEFINDLKREEEV